MRKWSQNDNGVAAKHTESPTRYTPTAEPCWLYPSTVVFGAAVLVCLKSSRTPSIHRWFSVAFPDLKPPGGKIVKIQREISQPSKASGEVVEDECEPR